MQHVIADLSFRLAHQEESMHSMLSHRHDASYLSRPDYHGNINNNVIDRSQIQMFVQSVQDNNVRRVQENNSRNVQPEQQQQQQQQQLQQHYHLRSDEGDLLKPLPTLVSRSAAVNRIDAPVDANLLGDDLMRKRVRK